MNTHKFLSVVAVALLGGVACLAHAEPDIPALNLDLSQTTVSGISSGAYMAVQFGVAHSATVHGVAATAGGPYSCGAKDPLPSAGVSKAIAQCMQGDPSYPAKAITQTDMDQMVAAARAWSGKGLIDDVANLSRQTVWLFHGYNDGIVKKPVSDALYQWYSQFVPVSQIFYKDQLGAGHAQVSANCSASSTVCNPCATTGGKFINACKDGGNALYDAAGAALQLFYGPLVRTESDSLKGEVRSFDQRPYTRRSGQAIDPIKMAMGKTGYLYVPQACAAGQTCRLHVAFHGCMQQAEAIGKTFVNRAGFNEWADANRIVVLYPQAAATMASPITPMTGMGCWDWWGYNDFGYQMLGRYATKDGDQIAAVWSMVEKLASGAQGTVSQAAVDGPPAVSVVDASEKQVALIWKPVAGASGYRVYRNGQPVTAGTLQTTAMVDNGLGPTGSYAYTVRSLDSGGAEGPASATVSAKTAATPPACDPYYSLLGNRPVTRQNKPTKTTCP